MASQNIQRKLAAILSADVAGYSRLMSVDEEDTLNSPLIKWLFPALTPR